MTEHDSASGGPRQKKKRPPLLYMSQPTIVDRMCPPFTTEMIAKHLAVKWGVPLPDKWKKTGEEPERKTEASPAAEMPAAPAPEAAPMPVEEQTTAAELKTASAPEAAVQPPTETTPVSETTAPPEAVAAPVTPSQLDGRKALPTVKLPQNEVRPELRPAFHEELTPPTKEELFSIRGYVISSGKPASFSHPELHGMAFSEDEWETAARYATLSATLLMSESEPGSSLSAEEQRPIEFVRSHPDFAEAVKTHNCTTQMRIAFEAMLLERRIKQLSGSPWSVELQKQAEEDVGFARQLTNLYLNKPKGKRQFETIWRMLELSKKPEYIRAPVYEIAMAVVDEMRKKNEPLVVGEETELSVNAVVAVMPPAAASAEQETAPLPVPEAELPKFDFPSWMNNSSFDAEVEALLPQGRDAKSTLVRRVARALICYTRSGFQDEDIDQRCLPAVRALRVNYSPKYIVDAARAIVEGTSLLNVAVMLDKLGDTEKELIAAITKRSVCDNETLDAFLAMHPGERELLMQQFIASRWREGDFRTDVHKYNIAKENICKLTSQLFGFGEPTAEEKLKAITNPAMLTDMQKSVVASFFGIDATTITPEHISEFGVWVSSDPKSTAGRQALENYWNSRYANPEDIINLAQKASIPTSSYSEAERRMLEVIFGEKWDALRYKRLGDSVGTITNYARTLHAKKNFWMHTPYKERLAFWKRSALDVMSVGRLAHNLRGYSTTPSFSSEEAALVSWIYGKDIEDVMQLSDKTKTHLANAFSTHTFRAGDGNGGVAISYFPELQRLAALGDAMRSVSLRNAAMKEAEVRILLDFLGARVEKAHGFVHSQHGGSRAGRDKNDMPKPNDDSCSSANVFLPDGSTITLDMVADGMGGHTEGANGWQTNGQIASSIAKEMFEVAAVAGWLRTPEDVRILMLAVDIAIVVEQIYRKEHAIAEAEITGVWRQMDLDPADPSLSLLQKKQFAEQVQRRALERMRNNDMNPVSMRPGNNMGTTMTVAFQKGKSLWFIHCGDSDGKVIREGDVVFSTVGHSADYDTRMEAEKKARAEMPGATEEQIRQRAEEIYREFVAAIVKRKVREAVIKHWKSHGFEPGNLDEAQKAELERQIEEGFASCINEMQVQAHKETEESFISKGFDLETLSEAENAEFRRQALKAFDELMAGIAFGKNEVSSALGVRPCYIHINNMDVGYSPFELEAGDAVLVASDGVTVPICDHEYGIFLFRICSSDMDAAREHILDIAEMRRKDPHEPMCGCRPRKGRKDDMSVLFRYAEEAFPEAHEYYSSAGRLAWLKRHVALQPKKLGASKSLKMIVEGCTARSMGKKRLKYVFDRIIGGAEEASGEERADAHNLATRIIFDIVSGREDCEELIDMLIPQIGSWSGLIIKRLRDSTEVSARERAMFDFVAKSAGAEGLKKLLSASRSEISGWAEEALGRGSGNGGKCVATGGVAFSTNTGPQPIFHSQTDEHGRPLDINATRYLETLEANDSNIVRDVASRVNVLPRDLEIMVFYVYSNFNAESAVDPHASEEGRALIAKVRDHLRTADAERIIMASYIIYMLKEQPLELTQTTEMYKALCTLVGRMNPHADYAQMFQNKAYELRKNYGDSSRSF